MRAMIAAPPAFPSPLPRALAAHGMALDPVEDLGDLGGALAAGGPFDIILLDVARRHRDAAAALRDLRRRGMTVPAIVLCTGLAGTEEETLLNAGADDVLLHPVRPAALLARMQVAVRRARGHASGMLRAGVLTLDQQQRAALIGEERLPLTGGEYRVLELLMLHGGRLLTKDRLLSSLYGGEDGRNGRVIDVFICKLRRKLAAAGAPDMIRTVRGQGYMLVTGAPRSVAERPLAG